MTEKLTTYKGFDADMRCREFQYAIGGTYEHNGPVRACDSGFHACEYPLDVFAYYAPSGSKFAVVEQSGELSKHDDDSKVASSKISVKASIDIPGLIKAAIEYTIARCNPIDPRSPAFTDQNLGIASATGDSAASSATGDSAASSATGDRAASSATGYRAASLSTGAYSSSEIIPDADSKQLHAVAVGAGHSNKVRAPIGSAIVCVYRNDDGELAHIRASKVGDNGIKPDTWYSLGADGEFVEVQS